MPSVAFWFGQPGGTAEYRAFVPGRALERLGWDVAFLEDLDVTPAGRVRGDPDILVIVRVMNADLPAVVRQIRRDGRTTVVYDADDWFLGVPDYNPASRLSPLAVGAMHDAMSLSHLVTCSTPELAEGYSRLNRTVVLPNYLDSEIWTDNDHLWVDHDGIHVGWLGAFGWRAGDLDLLKPWLPRFLDDHPDVRFVAAGCGELLDYLGIDGLTTPKSDDVLPGFNSNLHPYAHLPAMLGGIDIGLVPLTYNRFNQAKSWCKGMEYNAMGIPAVASPSREYRRFVRPGVNGYLVRHNEWARTVERAIADLPALRAGALLTASRYFIDDHIAKWVAAYASVFADAR